MTDEHAPSHRAEPAPDQDAGNTAERAPLGSDDTAERVPVTPAEPLPPAYVRLQLQGNVLLSMITPKVQIDGYPAPSTYGENLYPVAPGTHVVSANAQWMWSYGRAQEQVTLEPGQTAELFYATPVLTFLPGAMGTTKQRHPGMMILLLLCGVAAALVVGLVVTLAGA